MTKLENEWYVSSKGFTAASFRSKPLAMNYVRSLFDQGAKRVEVKFTTTMIDRRAGDTPMKPQIFKYKKGDKIP